MKFRRLIFEILYSKRWKFFIVVLLFFSLGKVGFYFSGYKSAITFDCKSAGDFTKNDVEKNLPSDLHCLVLSNLDASKTYKLKVAIFSFKHSKITADVLEKGGVLFPREAYDLTEGVNQVSLFLKPKDSIIKIIIQSGLQQNFVVSKFEVSETDEKPSYNEVSASVGSVKAEAERLLSKILKNHSRLDDLHKVLLINQFVYNYCSFDPPIEKDNTKLFENCRTRCWGFSFVLTELLKAAGIPARQTGIYNIPAQGTHSLAEALVNNKWILLDPTFGVVFSDASENYFGLSELMFQYYFKNPVEIMKQAKKVKDWPLGIDASSYSGASFKSYYMEPNYYTVAEGYGPSEDSTIVHSTLILKPGQSFGVFEGDEASASKRFLQATNDTLNNEIVDIPFSASFVGVIPTGRFQPILKLSDLKDGKRYKLKFYLVSYSDETKLRIYANSDLAMNAKSYLSLQKGMQLVESSWSAKSDEGLIILDTDKHIKIFGYGWQEDESI